MEERRRRRRRRRNIRPRCHVRLRPRFSRGLRPLSLSLMLSFHSLSGRPKPPSSPSPLTKTNGTYLFHGTPASGFPLSPLCIALVKHFPRFFFPFHPPFLSRNPHISPRQPLSGRAIPLTCALIFHGRSVCECTGMSLTRTAKFGTIDLQR